MTLVIVYYVVPGRRPWVAAGVGLLSLAAITLGVRWLRPQRRGAWFLIGATVALLTIGDVILASASGSPRYPGLPDLFYVAAYPALAIGMLWLGRPRLASRDWAMILDAAALSLAGSLLVWLMIVREVVAGDNLTGLGLATAVASWVGYVAVLAASARVLLSWPTNSALAVLSAGVFAFLVADFFYSHEIAVGTWRMGSLVDLGYLAFALLCGGAALTGSVRHIASAASGREQVRPVRLALVAAAMLVAPTVLLAEATAGEIDTLAAIAAVSATVGLLVLARLSLTARAYQRRGALERTMRRASRSLVLAATEPDVIHAVRQALRAMVPRAATASVRVAEVEHRGAALGEPRPVGVVAGFRGAVLGEVALPVTEEVSAGRAGSRRERVLVFTAPMAALIDLDTIVATLADQAGSALDRIRLTEKVHADERERYFRTLVETSEDVTLISHRGRVTFATPSARAMFGRDVTGELTDGLVLAEPPTITREPRSAAEEIAGIDGYASRDDRVVEIRARVRDLTDDPDVGGVVTTVRDTTAQRRLERDLSFRANHDALTGLPNAQRFREELSAAPRSGRAALFIDLDDFKSVNDTYGHRVGDQLLAETARRITSCLREGDLVARLGGDEFAAVLLDIGDGATAEAVAQDVVEAMARPARLPSAELTCTVSVGVAYAAAGEGTDELLNHADIALYSAKAAGRRGWRTYHPGMPLRTHQPRNYLS